MIVHLLHLGDDMCRRSDSDPLVRVLTDRYKLNILRLPRRGVGVGELLIREKGDLRCAGNIRNCYDPELELPPVDMSPLPNIDEITSARRSAKMAVAPLTGLLTALGAVGVSSIDVSHRNAHGVTVAFRLTGTRYLSTPLLTLGAELRSRLLRPRHALYQPDREYFVAYAAAEATGMQVAYSTDSDQAANLMLELTAMSKAETAVEAVSGKAGHFVISSPEPVTFGLAVARLVVDGRSLRLDTPVRLYPVRGKAKPEPVGEDPEPVFFGGPEGDALVAVG